MNVNKFKSASLKPESVQLLRDLAHTEDNNLSKRT